MSGELALIAAAAAAAAPPAETITTAAPAAEQLDVYALSLGIPSTDGWRGGQLTLERYFADYRIAVGAAAELRESAAGDYTGMRIGSALQVRRFGQEKPYLSVLPRGSMAGWFVGAAVHVDTNVMHDDVDSRWLASTLQLGVSAEVGYRIAPWRKLIITPTFGAEAHHDFDLTGRLPGWNKYGLTGGLELGWLF